MKGAFVLLLAGLLVFFLWNEQKSTYDPSPLSDMNQVTPLSPDIIQAIIAKAQTIKPNIVPINTVFINKQPDGTYNSRISFFNTKHFYGVQYDINSKVNSDGSVEILNVGDSPKVDANFGYTPGKYQAWSSVSDSISTQLKGALQPTGTKNELVTDVNLQTRS